MDTLEMNLAQSLRQALRPIWRLLNAHRTLSTGKLDVLVHLSEHGPATSAVLASAAKISPQAIATAVRELEELELVSRTPDAQDRRRVWIALTDTGRERLEHERTIGNAWLEKAITDGLSADEKKLLHTAIPLLEKLTKGSALD